MKTECGRDLADVSNVLTRDDARTLITRFGSQRAAFILCMTCVSASDRYADWQVAPASVVARDGASKYRPALTLMDRELFAIAALIERHRAEFDGYLAGIEETVSLAQHRAAQRPAPRQPRRL